MIDHTHMVTDHTAVRSTRTGVVADGRGDGAQRGCERLHRQAALAGRGRCGLAHLGARHRMRMCTPLCVRSAACCHTREPSCTQHPAFWDVPDLLA